MANPTPTVGRATPPSARPRSWPSTLTGPRVAPWVFIAPFFLLLIAFTIAPTIYALVMSLKSDSSSAFVGLDNYSTVVHDSDFQASAAVIWQSVYTLAPLFCIVVTVSALLLDGNAGWGKSWMKLLIFLPYAIPATASTILWSYNYSPDFSVFSPLLHGAGVQDVLAFATPRVLPYTIMNIVVWQNVGAWVVVLTASLAGIPQELVEMARIEGAGALSIIWHIKLRLVAPVLVLMVVSVVSYVLTLITEPYLLQKAMQVPVTFTPNMWVYNTSFQAGAFNLAAAASVLMLLVSAAFAFALVLRSGIYRLQDRG